MIAKRIISSWAVLALSTGLLAAVAMWSIGLAVGSARDAGERLVAMEREIEELSHARPATTTSNAGRLERQLAELCAQRDELRNRAAPSLAAGMLVARKPPRQRAEAFFDLAEFVEATRRRARRQNVRLRPDERFGLSAYAHEAPPLGRIVEVFRERLVIEHLLVALIDAGPVELLAVQRASKGRKPGSSTATTTRAPASRRATVPNDASDEFEPDRRFLTPEGLLHANCVRVVFTGETRVLREFLGTLAEADVPLFVRSVEVTPHSQASGKSPAAVDRQPESGPRPIVSAGVCRFSVVVEAIDLRTPGAS